MAVSITSRPSTWSAAKNPIVYKFTTSGGPYVNYRIEVEVFDDDDNSLGPKLSYSPDANGVTIADVSAIVRSHLLADWEFENADQETDEELNWKRFYIRYQELYDGSDTEVISDTIEIHEDHAVNDTSFATGWANVGAVGDEWTFGSGEARVTTDNALPGAKVGRYLIGQTLPVGALISGRFMAKLETGQSGRFGISAHNGSTAQQLYITDTIVGDDTAHEYTFSDVELTQTMDRVWIGYTFVSGSEADAVYEEIEVEYYYEQESDTNKRNAILGAVQIPSPVGNSMEKYIPTDATTKFLTKFSRPKMYRAGNSFYPFTLSVIENSDVDNCLITEYSEDGNFINETPIDLVLGDGVARIHLHNHSFDSEAHHFTIRLVNGASEPLSELLTIDLMEPCDNPVYLFFKNSLGGDSWWMFDRNQEISYSTSGERLKRMMLFANHLTANEWDALNDLNNLNEVSRANILELTADVNKTHIKAGTQVYAVDAEGNKTGVIVNPTSNVMFSKQRRHEFRVEIEFPEIYE